MNHDMIDQYILVVADFLCQGASDKNIVEQCTSVGLSSDDIFLILQAAKIIAGDRVQARLNTKPKTFKRV